MRIEENENNNKKTDSFHQMMKLNYGYIPQTFNKWPNIRFTESGRSRLGRVAGWLLGLSYKNRELALDLADDFVTRISRLNDWGGTIEVIEGVKVSSCQIVLSDDGTFNGFAMVSYRPVLPEKWEAKFNQFVHEARQEMLRKVEDGILSSHQESMASNMGTRQADQHFKINNDLTVIRYTASGHGYSISHCIRYGLSMIGGVLYHGPGKGENFATIIGDVNGWALHT